MVMTLTVNYEGRVCVSYDEALNAMPVGMNYSAEDKTLTVLLDNGTYAKIGSATMPEISKRLQKARSIMLKQMSNHGAKAEVEVPLYILFGDDHDKKNQDVM